METLINLDDLNNHEVANPDVPVASAAAVNAHTPYLPDQLILLFSADDWEDFIKEWAYYQKASYKLVARLGGAYDYGVDVACFKSANGFEGAWDNFQCKHYNTPLTPSTALLEVGKILWHIFNGRLSQPDWYYFFAPKDCGPSLIKLLTTHSKLKTQLINDWKKNCETKIGKEPVKLSGEFKDFVEAFSFQIFQYKPSIDVIEEHRNTPYFSVRFGGGLKDRDEVSSPPINPTEIESRYVEQLYEAYSDHLKSNINSSNIDQNSNLRGHYDRSREMFYSAEHLRNYARDSVPQGTYEDLKDQVFHAVVDEVEANHVDGFIRVKEVTKVAQSLTFNSNGLFEVVSTKDQRGMCHQLANEDKIKWVPKDE